jgi:hypothetical protein
MEELANKQRAFFAAIIQQAVEDAQKGHLDAKKWLLTNYPESNYSEICKGAGVDPDDFRFKLKRMKPELMK